MTDFKGILLLFAVFLFSGPVFAEVSDDVLIIDITTNKAKINDENNIIPIKTDLSAEQEAETVLTNSAPPYDNKLELNDKVLNYALFSMQPVPFVSEIKESIIYQETQHIYNALDPLKLNNANSYYPGLRGPNQLIIYTPNYGLRTGTNEYGTEAIVENNMVVRLNGADSVIPKNGFVISGHGSAKKWISKNIQTGSKVYIDYPNNRIKVFLTPESLLFAAKEKIKEVSSLVEYYRQLDILYNDKKANTALEISKTALRNAEKKPEKTQSYINNAMEALDDAIKNAIPYFSSELKGIWARPVEKTPEQIEKTVERMYEAGITDVFLEAYFHGKTIYPSKYMFESGVISQNPDFEGFDPLEVWISEAHKRGMKLHIWFESFYAGNDNPKITANHILNVYPLWANKRFSDYDKEDPLPSLSEHNGYFLDPANIQVQIFLIGILTELINNYEIDGINLDYIRYPQTVDPSYSNYVTTNWGYTKAARDEFKSIYGIDPVEISYNSEYWELWVLYRQNQITGFLRRVKDLVRDKNILLTAVIFPDLKKCGATKMQNWRLWSMNNYIDGLTPLLLTGDKNTAVMLLNDVFKNTSPATKIYPGIFVAFMDGSFEDLLIQLHKTREFKSKGAVIFDYAHLNDKYIDALKTRIFNKNYDEREFKLSLPDNYKPEVRYKTKKQSKKTSRR